MFRFHVNKKEDNYFELDQGVLKHMKAARVFNEEFICVFEENFYLCKYEDQRAKIIKNLELNHEFNGEVVMAISIIDTKRLEWLIQKATELGATKLIPVYSKNVSKKISGDIAKKLERWNMIATNAAEQAFRNKPMIVVEPMKYEDVLKINIDNKYIAYVKEDNRPEYSFPINSMFLIGPEGGYTPEEVASAEQNGFKVISLGKRILRAETAGIFVLSRINE